jgi:hypothetical protein
LREAEFDCARYSACYDPPSRDWGIWSTWSGLEWFLVLLIAVLIIGLLLAWILNPPKPEKPLRVRVEEVLDNAEQEASNWDDQEAVRLLRRTRAKIVGEFAKT